MTISAVTQRYKDMTKAGRDVQDQIKYEHINQTCLMIISEPPCSAAAFCNCYFSTNNTENF
jgi:hypothetical protein